MLNANLAGDETAVGQLLAAGPDGVLYQDLDDGSSAQAFASPGYYNPNGNTIVYSDGSEGPAPNDSVTMIDSGAGPMGAHPNLSPAQCPQQPQNLSYVYTPNITAGGIGREVQTQPGYPSIMSYIGLPSSSYLGSSSNTNVDGRPWKPGQPGSSAFQTQDTGYIYTGGTAIVSRVGRNHITKNYGFELDAGLTLVQTGDTGWRPFLAAKNATHHAYLGFPLEADTAAGGTPTPYVIYATGEPLIAFKAAGYGTIPDKHAVFGVHGLGSGRVYGYNTQRHALTDVHDVTLVYSGLQGWIKSACIVLKRENTIAQTFHLIFPPGAGPPMVTPSPDGPGGTFKKTGSYVLGASWGDFVDGGAIDGVTLFPGGQWTADPTVTWLAGSYPNANNPSPGNPYVGWLSQNDFFWEQNINLQTRP